MQLQVNLHYTNYSTWQLQLHYATLQLQLHLHYTTLHPAIVGKVTATNIQPLEKKHNNCHRFGPPVDSLCHPWFTTPHLS